MATRLLVLLSQRWCFDVVAPVCVCVCVCVCPCCVALRRARCGACFTCSFLVPFLGCLSFHVRRFSYAAVCGGGCLRCCVHGRFVVACFLRTSVCWLQPYAAADQPNATNTLVHFCIRLALSRVTAVHLHPLPYPVLRMRLLRLLLLLLL